MRPVHGLKHQRVHRMMLREEHRVIGKTAAQAVLIQHLDLVLVLVPEPFLLVIDAQIERFAVEIILMMRLRWPGRWAHVRLLLLLLLVLIRRAGQAATVTVAEVVRQLLDVRHADAQGINTGLLRAYVARHLSRTRVLLPHGWRILRVVQQRRGQDDAIEVSVHHTASNTRLGSCSSPGMVCNGEHARVNRSISGEGELF